MLHWFVEKKIALAVLDGKQMIEQNEVQISPEKITDAVLDKDIDIHLIQKYFSRDAWQTVIGAVKIKIANCFSPANLAIIMLMSLHQYNVSSVYAGIIFAVWH